MEKTEISGIIGISHAWDSLICTYSLQDHENVVTNHMYTILSHWLLIELLVEKQESVWLQ